MVQTRFIIMMAVVLAAGCGGRTLTGVGDASTNGNNSNHGNANGNTSADAGVGECVDGRCTIGIRTDNCCEAAFATTLDAVLSDPCLVVWPMIWDTIPQSCLDAWDPECDFIDCMPGPPQWRIAECTDRNGVCEMIPECSRASDCVLAVDHRKCCPCPEGVPPELIDRDPCFTAYPNGGTTVPVECLPTMCPEMPCSQCTDSPPECIDNGVCWNDNPGW